MASQQGKVDAYMPLWIGDYLADTLRLNTLQHGAYILLIMDYWRNGQPPMDDDTLSHICRMDKATWKKSRDAILPFFTVQDGKLFHKRIEKELKDAAENKLKHIARAEKAAEARWGKRPPDMSQSTTTSNATSIPKGEPKGDAKDDPQTMLEECPLPSPLPIKKEEAPPTPRNGGSELPPIPPELDTLEFREAWEGWLKYRRTERKPSVKPHGAKLTFKMMIGIGPERAIAAINNSITHGYQGIVEPKNGGSGGYFSKLEAQKNLTDLAWEAIDEQAARANENKAAASGTRPLPAIAGGLA